MNALESAGQKFVQNAKHNAAVLKECREKTWLPKKKEKSPSDLNKSQKFGQHQNKKCQKNCSICESIFYIDSINFVDLFVKNQ
jgi:hypothetical protein